MKVRLITKTIGVDGTEYHNRSIDDIILGQARVSSGRDADTLFDEPYKLIRHCVHNAHWSIFELANLGFEIKTSRAIGRELLRHGKLIGLTEFSQRYSSNIEFEDVELRKQSVSNRQSSSEQFDPILTSWGKNRPASDVVKGNINQIENLYTDMIGEGVAKETARFILPETTTTTIYMNGRIREWITFLNARLHKTAQKEIRELAEVIKIIFMEQCPLISKALYNFDNAENVHILDRIVLEKYKVYNLI